MKFCRLTGRLIIGVKRMDIIYIKEFAVLAETQYYAEAAEKMFISPSSLTRHIQLMEKEFGKPLFIRTSRKVKLTEFGESFLVYAKKIIYHYEEFCENHLVAVRREKKIIVGCSGGLAPHNVGTMISRFRKDNPEIEMEYIHIRPESQLEMLHDNMYDFLITEEDRVSGTEFNYLVCGEDDYVLAIPETHFLAGKEKITIPEIADQHFAIVYPLSYEDGEFIGECRRAGINPNFIVIDAGSAIDYVVVGGCPVVMSRQSAALFSGISTIKIEPEIKKKMILVYRKSPELSAKEKRFLKYIRMSVGKIY